MSEFKYKIIEGDVVGCDSCASDAPVDTFYKREIGKASETERHLCELCASSFIGNATEYSNQYDNVPLFVSIAQVGNIILDQTTDRRKAIKEAKDVAAGANSNDIS